MCISDHKSKEINKGTEGRTERRRNIEKRTNRKDGKKKQWKEGRKERTGKR